MKRIIFGILVLVGVWRLLQLSSINAAFFAFLTLGINPITNHPFSTPSLISILFAISIASLLLLFNRALTDFFGGLADWLTRPDQVYGATNEAASESLRVSLASLPARATIQDLAEPQSASAAMLASLSANLHALSLPTFGARRIHAYIARFSQYYSRLIGSARARLQTVKTPPTKTPQTISEPQKSEHDADLVPELAEVVAIFEQMAREVEASEPQEAVIVEPKTSIPSPVSLLLSRLRGMLDLARRALLRDAARAGTMSRAAEQQADVIAHKTGKLVQRVTLALYRGILLATLGVLLGSSFVLHGLHAALGAIGRGIMLAYRRACRRAVVSAVTITLGLFAVGRGIKSVMNAIGRGLATLCRGVYKLLANGIMLAFLSAGYVLLVFSVLCFILWEVFEPYARKFDKWLGDKISDKESFAEVAKVGHEMSRTFAGWYRQLRDIKRSTLN